MEKQENDIHFSHFLGKKMLDLYILFMENAGKLRKKHYRHTQQTLFLRYTSKNIAIFFKAYYTPPEAQITCTKTLTIYSPTTFAKSSEKKEM